MQFTRKVFGADGSFAGVVVCSLDPYWFTQFLELLDFGGTMLLPRKDGVVRAAAPDGALLGQNISDTPLGRAAVGAVSGTLRMPAMEGAAEQIVSFRQLRNHPIAVAIETAPLAGDAGASSSAPSRSAGS
ncbi:hypothetical protein ACFQX4_11670 [Roseomonas sp. GCM10028921]